MSNTNVIEEQIKNYAIVGRIPGDDEETCLVFEDTTRSSAIKQYEAKVYDGREETPEDIVEGYGERAFISYILSSESPISIEQCFVG